MATSLPRRAQRALADRPPSKGDRREQRLLVEAERLVNAGRFQQASVAELAAAADLTRPTFYFYFASKQALLTTLVDASLRDITSQLESALAALSGTPSTRLRVAIAGAADAWWSHRAVMRMALELAATVPAIYDQTMSAIAEVNRMSVELVMEHGTVPEARNQQDAEALVLALALMNERNLQHALRSVTAREDLAALEAQLYRIWLRAIGLAGAPS